MLRSELSRVLGLIVLVGGCWGRSRPRRETCQIGEGVAAGQMDDKDMEEASGLAYSRRQSAILWTINDHGGPHKAIALGEDGKKVADATLKDIENVDFEDIASTVMDGVPMILVSDTGNNDHDRESLSILRFREPDVSSGQNVDIPREDIEDLQVRYEGFSYDCEALAVDETSGDLFMFTKDRENSISEVYRYPFPQSVNNNPFTLGKSGLIQFQSNILLSEHVATLPLFWITGADISPDGRTLVLTNKQEAFKYDKTDDGMSWVEFLVNQAEPSCILELNEEEQREAIAITEQGIWTTSECKDNPPCPLWFYPTKK